MSALRVEITITVKAEPPDQPGSGFTVTRVSKHVVTGESIGDRRTNMGQAIDTAADAFMVEGIEVGRS